MANSSSIDLSQLPSPDAVETLDYPTVYAANIALVTALLLAVGIVDYDLTDDTDPVVILIQTFSYRELVWRARINDSVKAVLIAKALGADLDQLGAIMDVARKVITPADPDTGAAAVMESDTEYRLRIVLAPQGFSVAGPVGAYIFHALSASGDVRDASATAPKPDDIKAQVINLLQAHSVDSAVIADMQAMLDNAVWPGTVIATVLSRTGDGTAPQATLDAVNAVLSKDTVRPLTDLVLVRSAEILPFGVGATLFFFSGPDRAIVMAAARTSLDAYLASSLLLGRDITRAGIIAALYVPGVQNVVLDSPVADIVASDLQAGYCTGINLIDGGLAE